MMGAANKRPLASKKTRCLDGSESEDESAIGNHHTIRVGTKKKRRKTIHTISPNNVVTHNSHTANDTYHDTTATSRASTTNFDLVASTTATLNHKEQSRIYNFGCREKPAELFRKDLISAMKLTDSEQLNDCDYILITDQWKEEWEKGVQVPVNPEALPTSSYRVSYTNKRYHRDSTDNNNNNNNNDSTCQISMPREWIRYDPSANNDPGYELDAVDLSWQELMAQTCVPPIPESLIESTITELERQCAENMKNHKIGIEFSESVVCDVCRSPYSEEGNEIIFCDKCSTSLHQACYGIDEIPDGQWFCQPCKELGNPDKASCILCPNRGGAMRRAPNNQWAHVSCALWVVSHHIDLESSAKIKVETKEAKCKSRKARIVKGPGNTSVRSMRAKI